MSQVHKEPLTQIENAMPGRGAGDIEIFGMEGIPADILEEFRQRVIGKYYQEHGQPVQQVQGPGKKIKKETPEELKARLAEFRAKKAVEKEALKLAETKTSSDAGQDGDNNADVAGNPAPPVSRLLGVLILDSKATADNGVTLASNGTRIASTQSRSRLSWLFATCTWSRRILPP